MEEDIIEDAEIVRQHLKKEINKNHQQLPERSKSPAYSFFFSPKDNKAF